ncbi:hypothetical protein B0T14DRAFT_289370 [Immersiella caudata]|uniref:SWIM-type domain-containing protein n=1 Tax=Immersiella caudata TaxID=314043 RepID=A0AA40BUA8_9PEZI|nr:hypothetical protein B0T14DRAFT_289370 [Immersiella caudata]
MASSSLPTHRTLLNSLLDAIARIPLQSPPTTIPIKTEDNSKPPNQNLNSSTENALTRVPATHRHLLITLHVIFPSILLPALDLLDRNLVVRLVLDNTLSKSETKEEPPPQQPKAKANSTRSTEDPPSFYLVHSAQTSSHPRRRRRDDEGSESGRGTGKAYLVRLGAWNCTCAAFAFAGFPVGGHGDGSEIAGAGERVDGGDKMHVDVDVDVEPGGEQRVSFGGFTFEDRTEEGLPVCKHILACLLGERWGDALGGHLVDRRVGREEMAGIVADI